MAATPNRQFKNICVLSGFNYGKYKEFVEATIDLGRSIAERKLRLVYGGGNRGLSKLVSEAVFLRGSQVLGIIPRPLKPLGSLSDPPTEEELVVSGFMHVLLTTLRSRSNGWSNFKSQHHTWHHLTPSDLPKERLRFGGLMGGSGRPEYKDSDPPTCFTNHCHVAQSWPLNHERLRFGQDCQLSHALISIVSSFHHPISARSTGKVNFFYTSPILSRS
ncbi:hypothetical protein WN944_015009 [Citrus x changshan-huyou]|uniref:Uncharacterized protein n=1 Tax=Citrus x changshan-huyou TaxID=2935761 RepID=A0AAP0M6P4_9ROSI